MRSFLVTAFATWLVVFWMATRADPGPWLSWLWTAIGVFVLLPWVISVCLALVCSVAAGVVVTASILASPWRSSGASDLLADLARLPASIPPGYYRFLSSIRSPRVWGFATGVGLAAIAQQRDPQGALQVRYGCLRALRRRSLPCFSLHCIEMPDSGVLSIPV